ncbi:unnamed protein product [Soboliphyme baturini]|uniref:Serine/threonine-protein phosphatase 6 regulatory subunit 3-like n=1 Tax=Soboliphyme baturini TaxID=241478 RepID=A0A183J0I8_9BILA|nr:unnamed protein product [Soboliphyme baturini]
MEGRDRNPSPSEQSDNEDKCCDRIGETLYSEKFVLQLLVELCKIIESEAEAEEPSSTSSGLDLDPDLDKEFCVLWDMSTDHDVVKLIAECDGARIFRNLLMTTAKPRLKVLKPVN